MTSVQTQSVRTNEGIFIWISHFFLENYFYKHKNAPSIWSFKISGWQILGDTNAFLFLLYGIQLNLSADRQC